MHILLQCKWQWYRKVHTSYKMCTLIYLECPLTNKIFNMTITLVYIIEIKRKYKYIPYLSYTSELKYYIVWIVFLGNLNILHIFIQLKKKMIQFNNIIDKRTSAFLSLWIPRRSRAAIFEITTIRNMELYYSIKIFNEKI